MLFSSRFIENVLNLIKVNTRNYSLMINFNVSVKENNLLVQISRPHALNALNLSMVQELYRLLGDAEASRSMVIVKGGDRSFCAGGDVKLIARNQDPLYGQKFFRQEYVLNSLIASYGLPYVALIDGIVMGGGVGISIHGMFRVATENTVFAMPETAIGFFPDVGTALPLARMSNKLGYYLATTGARLYGLDVVKAGIATHFCEKEHLPELQNELMHLKLPTEESINDILTKFDTKSKDYEFSLNPILGNIDRAFSTDTMEKVIKNIQNDKSDWAIETLETLNKMSPTSLKVAFKELKLAEHINDIRDILQVDYRIAYRLIQTCDFKEGIRARLIDKTNDAKWNPSTIEEVCDKYIDYLFEEPLSSEVELNLKQ